MSVSKTSPRASNAAISKIFHLRRRRGKSHDLGTTQGGPAGASQTVIPHTDDATLRVADYCSAGPGGGFGFNQVISPGTTVAMDPITITESANASNGGIWATGPGANFNNGLRITIPGACRGNACLRARLRSEPRPEFSTFSGGFALGSMSPRCGAGC